MAKYKKRKDGRYCANIHLGYDENTGKRKFKTIYAHSIAELERKKVEILSERDKGIVIDSKNITLNEWSTKWLDTYKQGKSFKTVQMYSNIVRNHIIELGEIKLKDLKQIHIQKLINSRQNKRRISEQIKLTINQILESAIDNGMIYKNVCRNIELPSKEKTKKRELTDFEKSLIKKAD